MKKQPISKLQSLFRQGLITEELVSELRLDERKGVQNLIKGYEKQKRKEMELEVKYNEMCQIENRARSLGKQYIAGVDELEEAHWRVRSLLRLLYYHWILNYLA